MFPSIPNDPVVLGKALLRSYKHLDDREMPLTALRIMTAAIMSRRAMQDGITAKELAKHTGLTVTEVETHLEPLIETRHIHQIVPPFGEFRYKLGAVGKTFANSVVREFERGVAEQGEKQNRKA